jgi:S1-C subfamily serine protease
MRALKLHHKRCIPVAPAIMAGKRLTRIAPARLRYRGYLLAASLAGALTISFLVVRTSAAIPLGKHGGHSSQGYLGINIRDVSDEQITALRIKGTRGAEVVLVDHDGPACTAGMREHDVILQMDGKTIESAEQLRQMLRGMPADRTVTFLINRSGQQQTISTTLADRNTVGQEAWKRHITVPEPSSSWHGNGFFGSGASNGSDAPQHGFLRSSESLYTGALVEMMGPQLAGYFGTQTGLLVRAVDSNSPASAAGMHAGDVVVRVNDMPMVSSTEWVKVVHDNRGKPLSIVVLRDRKEQTLTLIPDTKKRSSLIPRLWPGVARHTELALGRLHHATAQE